MPKRYVDGSAISRSDKLLNVEPPSYRAEYAYLLTLALANGSFECVPRKIWSDLYSYNRPDVTIQTVEKMLAEYERAKMLFKFSANGKVWGFWVGNDKPGRLPSKAEQGKYPCGAPVPTEDMEEWLTQDVTPYVVDSTIDDISTKIDEASKTIDEAPRTFAGRVEVELNRVEAEVEGASRRAVEQAEVVVRDKSPDGKASSSSLSFSSKSQDKSNDSQPPVVKVKVPIPSATRKGTVTLSHPVRQKSPAPVQTQATPVPAPTEPWDALDFAFMNNEEFEGLTVKELKRVVLYHWKVAKPFWRNMVDSLEKLKKHLAAMHKQVPEDFRVSGGVELSLSWPDPNCTLCDGQGFIPGPHEGYIGINYQQANPCSCLVQDLYPWRRWKPRKDDE